LLSLALKPAYYVVHMWITGIAVATCFPFLLLGFQAKGFELFSDCDSLFRFLNNVPYFGKYFFSLLAIFIAPYYGYYKGLALERNAQYDFFLSLSLFQFPATC